jgi:hypothetical protein
VDQRKRLNSASRKKAAIPRGILLQELDIVPHFDCFFFAMSSSRKEICPLLPPTQAGLTHRCLSEAEKDTPEFYLNALKYGHYLWQTGHAGRAVLAITRALYADIAEEDDALRQWPLPYAPLKWIFTNHLSDDFPGNPRISFQHQATRLRGTRQDLRRARAWAVWALIREARPGLPGDTQYPVEEPKYEQIFNRLAQHGHSNEAELWRTTLSREL